MTEQEKYTEELDTTQLDAVAGGTEGAGELYPGQTDKPESTDWATVSGLGVQAGSYGIKDPAILQNPPGY